MPTFAQFLDQCPNQLARHCLLACGLPPEARINTQRLDGWYNLNWHDVQPQPDVTRFQMNCVGHFPPLATAAELCVWSETLQSAVKLATRTASKTASREFHPVEILSYTFHFEFTGDRIRIWLGQCPDCGLIYVGS